MIKYTVNPKMRPRQGVIKIYEVLGMDFEIVRDVRQIFANDTTIQLLYDNIARWVKRKYPQLIQRRREAMVSMDMLGWAPVTNNDIPNNEIWVEETIPSN